MATYAAFKSWASKEQAVDIRDAIAKFPGVGTQQLIAWLARFEVDAS